MLPFTDVGQLYFNVKRNSVIQRAVERIHLCLTCQHQAVSKRQIFWGISKQPTLNTHQGLIEGIRECDSKNVLSFFFKSVFYTKITVSKKKNVCALWSHHFDVDLQQEGDGGWHGGKGGR